MRERDTEREGMYGIFLKATPVCLNKQKKTDKLNLQKV